MLGTMNTCGAANRSEQRRCRHFTLGAPLGPRSNLDATVAACVDNAAKLREAVVGIGRTSTETFLTRQCADLLKLVNHMRTIVTAPTRPLSVVLIVISARPWRLCSGATSLTHLGCSPPLVLLKVASGFAQPSPLPSWL